MSNFIIKPSPERKIKNPNDDPNRSLKIANAQKRIKDGKLKFGSEAEERDYAKRVSANPHNVYGNPAFYPAETLTFATAKYAHRDCPTCKRVIYDEIECMYCGTDLKNIEPY